MLHQWRHLHLLKHAQRGLRQDGIESTPCGAMCVLCPACPHPGINLHDNWELDPKELQHV